MQSKPFIPTYFSNGTIQIPFDFSNLISIPVSETSQLIQPISSLPALIEQEQPLVESEVDKYNRLFDGIATNVENKFKKRLGVHDITGITSLLIKWIKEENGAIQFNLSKTKKSPKKVYSFQFFVEKIIIIENSDESYEEWINELNEVCEKDKGVYFSYFRNITLNYLIGLAEQMGIVQFTYKYGKLSQYGKMFTKPKIKSCIYKGRKMSLREMIIEGLEYCDSVIKLLSMPRTF